MTGCEGLKARAKSIPPCGIIRISKALDRLIALHFATGKHEKMRKWRAERAK
ncbi:MAG TPA: hypothetical protein VNC50_21890 [Planctomycetia bacterium]|nr:hypothetical protein [Planctomycetia bacterium]